MTALYNPALDFPVRRGIVAWFVVVHALGALGVVYLAFVHFDWRTVLCAIGLFFACHLATTIGMHRLYAHKAFEATKTLEVVLLILAAATMQSSAIWWAAYHRLHHAYADTERDPYGVLHGFVWAHIKWIPRAPDEIPKSAGELKENPLLTLQHRFYYPLGIFFGIVAPSLVCALWGDFLGGVLVAAFLRLLLQYHLTWVINSVSHYWGTRRYATAGTARTNGGLLAILTVGESYHERHHLAPTDWRLGDRWYDLDIGKWVLAALLALGLAREARSVPESVVVERAQRKSARRSKR